MAGAGTSTDAQAHRRVAAKLSVQYARGLALAHFVSVTELLVAVLALSGHAPGATHVHFTEKNTITAVVLAVLGTIAVALAGVVSLAPSLRWFVSGREPDSNERRTACKLSRRQSAIIAATWVVGAAIFVLVNPQAIVTSAVPTGLAVFFGASATVATALLLTQRTIRPIVAAAARDAEDLVRYPGVLARLINMWLLCSAIPTMAIAALILMRANGWIIPRTAAIDIPILVLSLVAVLVGLRGMVLVSRSISDPVHEVVAAMAEVEQGRIDSSVHVYERSEIGRLQSGFNRMVSGLKERDHLRDLFGRYVGDDVARRAVEEGASLSGDVRDAGILFIDLVGSTELAAHHPPEEVAGVLNDFFRSVVAAVDQRHGLINKFQGDAALAVFGAPLAIAGAASAALATARALGGQLRRLPLVDFGIGVSAGLVFAGNIGAENRYEYTVIGDAVNEAARLADLAKTSDRRILCSDAALARADAAEKRHWASCGSIAVRGRSQATHISAPTDNK
ncbi:adenylate/guanylate cyclase domain-containing protein [Mycobacterium sp.]|uniref:adenylate/guanylate cyclase domain-containing protein n=1 Tax=Mycobacterium sp. TaxID=1785 RepID=UPI002BF1B551|nr:adenylate/guanylate cyclase domain-containing protein [Mycobacterium sp.]HME48666.1 adenylate/guanylate cyclase domain-containing protein [Mycobacterium sp.]